MVLIRKWGSIILLLSLAGFVSLFAELGGGGANPTWAGVRKVLYLQEGKSVSAWNQLGRYTTYYEMVPAGDGTYIIKVDLYPGEYNFAFFALTDNSPPTGLLPNTTYWDAVPSTGRDVAFISSVSSESVVNTGAVSYTSISGDARRYLNLPDGVTSFFVYCNWASTPVVPGNFRARPGNGYVALSWGYPYAWWGSSSEEAKAIDVIAGGCYQILRSSEGPAGPYSVIATTPGYCFGYVDAAVNNGTEYYYVLVASDAYKGSSAEGDVNLSAVSSAKFSRPDIPVQMRFRVEDIDFKKVRQNGYLVWLTPEGGNQYSPLNKICGRLVKVKTKRKFFWLWL